MSDLEQYRNAVSDYAARGVNYMFHNEGNEHALVIFENIFSNAKNEIRIAANKLCNKEVAGRDGYISSLSAFLDKSGSELHILLSNRPSAEEVKAESCLYRMLYYHPAYKEKRIVIKDGNGRSFRDKDNKPIHLCMGDSKMYRIENDVTERKAVANFGDGETTERLNQSFDKVFESISDVIKLDDYYGS